MTDIKRILIVEDDFLINACLEDYLSSQGFDVVSASSCREAQSAMGSQPRFDGLIIDVSLPDGDGLALGQSIAKINSGLPIVYTTGHLLDSQTLSKQEGFVSKPYAYEGLLAELKKIHKAMTSAV